MNRKNLYKLVLDLLMLLTLALMFNKRAISMSFHEIGGLALIGVFLIHVLINGRWVKKVTAAIARKGMTAATRVGWLVDTLLLIAFAFIGVSGALISKQVFSFRVGGSWKMLHYFFSALSIILMGVHLGLHVSFAGRNLRRLLRLPPKAGRIAALALTAALVVYGGYSLCTTSFVQWLTAPFRAGMSAEGFGAMGGEGERERMRGRRDAGEADATDVGEAIATDVGEADAADAGGEAAPDSADIAEGFPAMRGRQGMGAQPGGGSLGDALKTLGQYLGEMFVFAALTALTRKALARLGKTKRRAKDATPSAHSEAP